MTNVCSGLAIAADKTMYFADGTNIRSVDPDGMIHTLIGHHRHLNVWQPIPCQGAIPAQQVCTVHNLCQTHHDGDRLRLEIQSCIVNFN